RDGFDGLSGDHLADGLSPAKDAGFLRMLHKGIQGGQGTMRKMAVERAHGVLLGNHDLALIDEHVDAMLIGVIRLRLKFSRFCWYPRGRHAPRGEALVRRCAAPALRAVPLAPARSARPPAHNKTNINPVMSARAAGSRRHVGRGHAPGYNSVPPREPQGLSSQSRPAPGQSAGRVPAAPAPGSRGGWPAAPGPA